MMSKAGVLPDLPARRRALLDHSTTLLVEAGAGSGKTALMAGRAALLLAAGIPTREIVAITFTEAAASELRERIEGFVNRLARANIPDELRVALPDGLSAEQSKAIAAADETLDELTCTTIHGFCQQLVKPYPVDAGIDPGATIIDPEAADLAYQDLVQAWLSARFGRDRGAEDNPPGHMRPPYSRRHQPVARNAAKVARRRSRNKDPAQSEGRSPRPTPSQARAASSSAMRAVQSEGQPTLQFGRATKERRGSP